ncbi:MAG: FdtA/QdtA family cupin domain-containing protein [Algoriphagus sp.]|uniref:sugar 3,4-ketoisomerase n=1 Tax=Algoriphagus sp. TaxID=1872435 RepID=UPI0026022AED|nr:FdtA/QdtA family cupin domain-containing protein [Algoriphagus sp.]MDG1276502.1 FdtA/QdtA family cupin domain-containing protein [Algoriphagus sp.]
MENSKNLQSPFLVPLPGESRASGDLHFWENSDLFPEGIQRCFWISNVAADETRGNHAHWKESQVLVALTGKLLIEIDSALGDKFSFSLSSPGEGLFIPPLHWTIVRFYPKSVLLGMSDKQFSEEDYIRDKDYFETIRKR